MITASRPTIQGEDWESLVIQLAKLQRSYTVQTDELIQAFASRYHPGIPEILKSMQEHREDDHGDVVEVVKSLNPVS